MTWPNSRPQSRDICLPFYYRLLVPAGKIAGVVSSHTDLAPTILNLAGKARPDLDGTPIPLSKEELATPLSGEHVNVEYWGRALPEGRYGKIGDDPLRPGAPRISARNNTYKALRIVADDYSFLYTVWCTGERELYDMRADSDQMHNLLSTGKVALPAQYTLAGRSLLDVTARLDALLLVLKSCKARSCHKPWENLHPHGNVRSLKDALRSRYDVFYDQQPKVSFSSCPLGHLVSEEGPQAVNVWYESMAEAGELQRQQVPLSSELH